MPSDKNGRFAAVRGPSCRLPATILVAGLAAIAGACNDGPAKESLAESEANRRAAIESWAWDPTEPGDFGEDWDRALPPAIARGPGPAAPTGPAARTEPRTYWSIVLRTFTNEGAEEAAATMIASLARVDPALGTAHAHTTPKGVRVLYGVYDGPDDPDAQRELERVQQIKLGERLVFPLAILVRIDEGAAGPAGPLELRSVRAKFPDVDPLYSLQIAVWGRFGNDRLDPDELRRRAEDHVRSLRAEGVEAYYHHDEGLGLSMVTVGLFDRTAYDPQSGIYSPELERLMQRFPQHLMNGEPVQVPVDRRRPGRGVRPQGPQLVLVPD